MLFLHNSYGTSEFPDCGNLEGEDCMGNLRWANTEPSMYCRKTNTDPSVHFRKANRNPSMHFRKAIRNFWSQFYFKVYSKIYSKHKYQFVSPWWMQYNLSSNSKLSSFYFLCFVHSFLFCSKVAILQFQANGTCRKRQTYRMFAPGGHPSEYYHSSTLINFIDLMAFTQACDLFNCKTQLML